MRIDPHKHKERYFAWKEKIRGRIPDISKTNSELILRYLDDMEKGLNIAKGSVKGSRSYPRLNNLRQRMIFLSKKFKELLKVEELTNLNEEQLVSFFSDMQKGIIKRENGEDIHYWMPDKDNNSVARFDTDSVWARFNCSRNPAYRNDGLGVRSVRAKI